MSNLNDARVDLAGKLAAAGIPATLDPATPPPCVLVDVPTVLGGVGVGGWGCEYPVQVIAVPPGNADAAAWMLEHVEAVLRTLGPAPAYPGTYDAAGKDCPAYTITYPLDVTNPDC